MFGPPSLESWKLLEGATEIVSLWKNVFVSQHKLKVFWTDSLLAGWLAGSLLNRSTLSELRKNPALSCPLEVASVSATRHRKAAEWRYARWCSFGMRVGVDGSGCLGRLPWALGAAWERSSVLFRWPALSTRRESPSWDGGTKRTNCFRQELQTGLEVQNRSPQALRWRLSMWPALLEGVAWTKRTTRAQRCQQRILLHHSGCGTPSTSDSHIDLYCSDGHQHPPLSFLLSKVVCPQKIKICSSVLLLPPGHSGTKF